MNRRLEELHEHLERRWGQRDRVATEILIGLMLRPSDVSTVPGAVAPWLILETDYPRREFSQSWFSWLPDLRSMASIRLSHWRQRIDIYNELETLRSIDPRPLVLVEAEWRRPQVRTHHDLDMTKTVLNRCLNLRVEHPRMVTTPDDNDIETLRRLVNRVIDHDYHATVASAAGRIGVIDDRLIDVSAAAAAVAPWVERLQRLNRHPQDWDTMMRSLRWIAGAMAYLHSADTAALSSVSVSYERLLRDMVPWPTRVLLMGMRAEGDTRYMKEYETYVRTANITKEYVYKEIRRLASEGVVTARNMKIHSCDPRVRAPYKWRLADDTYWRLMDYDQRLFT